MNTETNGFYRAKHIFPEQMFLRIRFMRKNY